MLLDRISHGWTQKKAESGCAIKHPWLRRVGGAALLFYAVKGMAWLMLWWWLS